MSVAAARYGLVGGQARARLWLQIGFWVAVAWLIVLPSLGGYVMYVFVTRTQGATIVSTLLYLTPPTTMLCCRHSADHFQRRKCGVHSGYRVQDQSHR